MSRFVRNLVLILVMLLAGGAGFVLLALNYSEPRLREGMVRYLETRFNAKAHLEDVTISLFPGVHISGRRLALRYRGDEDHPPLISVDEFSAEAPLSSLFLRQVLITNLVLVNLRITIQSGGSRLPAAIQEEMDHSLNRSAQGPASVTEFHVDRMVVDGARLTILPKNPDNEPLIFELSRLSIYSLARDQPLGFVTRMKNATPPGWIDSRGQFGPWNAMDPGMTPVWGTYVFRDADLAVFKGISGTLSSQGKYRGVLQRIEVTGSTETPDFSVRTARHPMRLSTEFQAIVDGMSGDTLLQPVRAALGDGTTFVCSGGVYKKSREKGKTVELDVRMERGRIEDLLQLVVPGKAALAGTIQFRSEFELPPEDRDVLDKLMLKGSFDVAKAEFTSPAVQNRIKELSRRSRGKPEEDPKERIVSELHGAFTLGNGRVSIPNLSFLVPGAQVRLAGSYNLSTESVDFHGTLAMDAKLSETQKGIKSILLKVVDPFFRKNGKTVLPIKAQGTAGKVDFGVDFRRNDHRD